ncbi:hypothetical protein M8J75_010529 [Diaphorina citri]|nr:hypothetical protein M8J75_010529 [Diaphorina citri]
MKKVFKFVKGGKKDGDGSAAARKDAAVAGIPASCSNDSLNNNGYHMDIYGADKGMNKLHKSAYQGNMDKLKLALKCTDIDTVDEMSRTALHFAITQRHTNIVWFLLNNKARMDIMDKDGFTAFHKAVQCGNTDCTHLMLERGADIDSTDDNGNTALHLATRQGYFNIAALLLKKGADLLQRTPLMLAARVGNIQLIHIFLQHGSHLDCCDSNGWTASDYAMIGGHQEIAKQLAQIPRPKTSMSTEKLDMLDTIGEDSELSDVDTSLDPNINNNSEVEHQIEVSIVSKKDISAHDSPLSCVTPPPLKPPRSWDLIQSGMIDTQNATVNNNTVQKRKSLTTLGSLESRRDSFVDNSNIASTPVEEPANDNGVIAENAMRNGTTTAENAMRNGTTTAENAMRNGTKAAENAMRGTEMGYSTEVACTGVVGEMKNIDGTDVGVHNKQPEEVTNVLDENNRNKGDSAKHMEDTNEDDIDTSLSSNSSSLLNELANNILVNQINKVVVDNQVSDDENVDTVNETGIAVVSGETVLGKTNDAKMESSRAGEAMEITRDVVKQGRAFFEKKTNSEEVLNNKNNSTTTNSSSNKNNNNNNTTTDSNNIAVKSKNTNEFAKDTEIVRAEELHLEPDSFVFNNERDEEIQMMILQNNLKEHRQFLIEKLDDVKSNEPCSSGMKSKELAEDSTKPDSNDGVETKEIESEQHVEKALCDLPKAIGEVKEDKRIHSGSEMNNQAPSDVDTDMKMVSASSYIADIPPSKLCDNFNSNPLIESIDTTCPPLSDTDAVHQYLASIQTDVSQSLESSNKVDSTVCSSCVGTTNESCDLMNKSCDYLINNIDQVLEHINSNANDVIQQNELLETHLSNELLEMQLSKELLETHLSNELLETHLSNELLETHLSKELLETHLSNELLETHLSNELLETHLSNEPINKEHSEEASDTENTYSDEETLGNLQDEKLLRNAMKHLPRHKSLDLSDDSMPYIASPKVKDAPGPNVHLFDELPPPPSDFQFPLPPSNLLDDQPSSASLVSLDNLPLPPYDSSSPPGNKSGANLPLGAPEDNLPLPPDDMLERLDTQCSIDSIQDDEDMLEEGGFCTGGGEKQLACIEEEETVSEMSNCKVTYPRTLCLYRPTDL